MGSRLSGLGTALYDPKRKELLGRDGARWGKLGVFYFFFYLGLAGFFCSMLAIFMAFTPRDRPRYDLEESRMQTRSNPLSPGLGFRPQPDGDKSLIVVKKNSNERNSYVDSLNKYLHVYYWKNDNFQRSDNGYGSYREPREVSRKFSINNPGDCRNDTQYGFSRGRPCVLVKMNKIVDFKPIPGYRDNEAAEFQGTCGQSRPDAVSVRCFGEYPADVDNIGTVEYISENGHDRRCGSLKTDRFPYLGKHNRTDVYQAPYLWAQFTDPKPNVLINVICRVYGQNIHYDKKTGRGLTRFQIYLEEGKRRDSSRRAGEV